MKKYLFLLLSFFAVASAAAQGLPQFHVVSFTEKPFDTAAHDERYKIIDGNGDLFSIIKLVSQTPDDDLRAYHFDFGLCEHRVKTVDGNVWIYIQRNAMHVAIKRDGYKTLQNYELNTTVQPGKVYEMVLSAEAKKVQKQMVYFSVSPASSGATIMYKRERPGAVEELLGTIDANGDLAENLELGTYTYKIISKNYHISEGRLVLDNVNDTYTETITLRPKFANITLVADAGVEIRIDNEVINNKVVTLNAGTYNVECAKAGYKPNTEVIKVQEGKDETITLKPLVPILGSLSLKSSPLKAKITIDGKDYGTTPKNINELIIGTHSVVISMDGYESVTKSVTIKEKETEYLNVTLEKKPEKGTLYITSSPKGANITIGSIAYGEAPRTVSNLLPGSYNVYASKKGYNSDVKLVSIKAGERKTVSFSLTKEAKKSSSSSSSSYKSSSKSSTKSSSTRKSYRSYRYRSDKWKKYVNFGITADLGGFPEDEQEDMVATFNVAGGLLCRFGSVEKNMFNFIMGAKYQYMSCGDLYSSQVIFPLNLNWNYIRGDFSCYLGLGYEPGFEFYEGGLEYVDTFTIQYFGFATRHHDFNAFVKVFGVYADVESSSYVPVTMGVSYTYYF